MGKILRLKQGNIPHTGLGLTLCWFSVILFDSALYFLIQLYTFNSFTVPPTPNTNLHKTDAPALNPHVMPCFEGLDTSQCPNCTGGLYCDGLHCVKKADCTCQYKNKIIMVRNLSLSFSLFLSLNIYLSSGLSIPLSLRVLSFFLQKTDIVTTDTCETCQCYSGELRCVPKSCPPCASVSTCITYLDLCSKECLRNNITEALATVKFAN